MHLLKNFVILIISTLFVFGSIQPLSASEQNDKTKSDQDETKTVTINMHYLGNLTPS